jgi:glycosyltransferase involved in cell wall biosynthesis
MVKRIRVVEIVGNADGGGTKCVSRLVQNLDPARFDLLVISPDSPWLARVCQQRGARYQSLPIFSSRLNWKTYRELARILGDAQPDIVSAHGTRAAWYTLLALKQSVHMPRIMYSEHLFSFDAREGVAKLPWLAIERYICRRVDALATGCDVNARFVESRGWIDPSRVAMRHYGVELEDFVAQSRHRVPRAELGLPERVPVIGTVGRLIPQKGIRYLLDAMVKVLAVYPDAILLIAGDGESWAELNSYSQRLGLAGHVRFLGATSQPWTALANCDVIAFSSLYEGMQQTCLEALAIGLPVVVTTMKGPVEYVESGRSGILVPPRDAQSLADGIIQLLNDPDLRQQFALAGPVAVQEYRTDWMIERYRLAYERLYGERIAARTGATQVAAASAPGAVNDDSG